MGRIVGIVLAALFYIYVYKYCQIVAIVLAALFYIYVFAYRQIVAIVLTAFCSDSRPGAQSLVQLQNS